MNTASAVLQGVLDCSKAQAPAGRAEGSGDVDEGVEGVELQRREAP